VPAFVSKYMQDLLRLRHHRKKGITLMEILVVVAIITVLAAIAFPIWTRWKGKTHMTEATGKIKALADSLKSYCEQNNGEMPLEDIDKRDDWEAVKRPEAEKAWYNVLPKQMGKKSVADLARENQVAVFYSAECPLWLPGANYPEKKQGIKPYFAMALNSKLSRKDRDGNTAGEAGRPQMKFSDIKDTARTVVFLEQGLPGESRAHPSISPKKDYNGSAKASAKSFVARYSDKGLLAFADGHVAPYSGKDLLDGAGDFIWSEQASVIWTADPKEDPNVKTQ
jgi:prepilin-type N-terminal cleavage/methylation domain-containing protein/prepilin-type processing-associated H-X9-DG protein